jgi:hypothetical protein
MSRWADAGTWVGDGLRREVFYFPSSGAELYCSVYAPSTSASVGVLLCNSWGFEGDQGSRLVHPLSMSFARAGGVAVSFHYPGFGDSHGELEEATMDALAGAAVDALGEAARRHPRTRWIAAGLMLGASVACLAADRAAGIDDLLLVQPALSPTRYFERLERASRRALGGPAAREGFAFGYPLAQAMLASTRRADAEVAAALSRFQGGGAVVRYEKPDEVERAPERFERICAPGTWRFGSQDNNHRDPALAHLATRWLLPRVEAVGPWQ